MNYYIATVKCGHVGRNKYILIDFPILATSVKEAAKLARYIPRVKHQHKNAIKGVRQVSKEEFEQQRAINDEDPYLLVQSIQDQRRHASIYERIIDEEIEEQEKTRADSLKLRAKRIIAQKKLDVYLYRQERRNNTLEYCY